MKALDCKIREQRIHSELKVKGKKNILGCSCIERTIKTAITRESIFCAVFSHHSAVSQTPSVNFIQLCQSHWISLLCEKTSIMQILLQWSLSDTWTPQNFRLLLNQEPHSFLQIMTEILYFQFTGRDRSGPDTLPLIKCSLRKGRQNWELFAFCGVAGGRSESSEGFSHAHALSGQEDKDSIPVHLSMDANSRWVFTVDL